MVHFIFAGIAALSNVLPKNFTDASKDDLDRISEYAGCNTISL
jgi:hypothetical protein